MKAIINRELQYSLKFNMDPRVFNKTNKSALNMYYAEVTLLNTHSAKYHAKYNGVYTNWKFKMLKLR